jgi:hypothetical protein
MLRVNTTFFYFTIITAVLWLFTRWNLKRLARKTYSQQKAIYSGAMEYADANPNDFNWLDLAFYDDVTAKFSHLSFRHVGDVECVTATRQYPGMRTFMRVFVGDGGNSMAACYHVKMRGMFGILSLFGVIPRNMRVVEFESEFSDQTFLATTTAPKKLIGDFPFLTHVCVDPNVSPAEMLARHREEMRRITNERGVQPVRLMSKADMLASQDRLQIMKSAHKKKVGYVTRDDFAGMAGGKLSTAQTKLVDEFERIRDTDKSA